MSDLIATESPLLKEIDQKPTLNEIYHELVDLEKNPPDPQEKIKTEQGYVPREQLLVQGYVFKNVLGGGEKPIIKTVVEGVNFGTKQLLTGDELRIIQQYQEQHPDLYGWQGFNPEDVRQDLISFLFSARPRPEIISTPGHTLAWAHSLILGDKPKLFSASEHDKQISDDYWWFLVHQFKYDIQEARDEWGKFTWSFVKENMPDIYPWQTQPHPLIGEPFRDNLKVSVMVTRRQTLVDCPSPFLDSGFHFPQGGDLTIYTPDNKRYRLNLAVFHLASRGLSEMGDGGKSSNDQHYLTVGEYIKYVFIKDPIKRAAEHRREEAMWQAASVDGWDVIAKMAKRFVELAGDWAKTPEGQRYLEELENETEETPQIVDK